MRPRLAPALLLAASLGAAAACLVDLQGAVEAIRRDLPHLTVGLVAPGGEGVHINRDLAKTVHWYKKLSARHLAAAQLPVKIPGSDIVKPREWS